MSDGQAPPETYELSDQTLEDIVNVLNNNLQLASGAVTKGNAVDAVQSLAAALGQAQATIKDLETTVRVQGKLLR